MTAPAAMGVGVSVEELPDGSRFVAIIRDGEGMEKILATGTEPEVERAARAHVDANRTGVPRKLTQRSAPRHDFRLRCGRRVDRTAAGDREAA